MSWIRNIRRRPSIDPPRDGESQVSAVMGPVQASFTTEATVTKDKILIEIHPDIYAHIKRYLDTGDWYHAVEESYKLVREKLRVITGKERATDAFAAASIEKIFGHPAANPAESDFFDGVKYLNMAIQFLRNEKAHTPAAPLEPNLATHYISLASLAYDLITRYVSQEMIDEIEALVDAKWRGFRTATAFYRSFEGGKWIDDFIPPLGFESPSVRMVLKEKWLKEADFTRSWDHSNLVLMRLQLVAAELSSGDVDVLLGLPTKDNYGNNQLAGMSQFLAFVEQRYPDKLSATAQRWTADGS